MFNTEKQRYERLFDVVQQCLQMDWTLPQQGRTGARSEFRDLRQFLGHRTAPIRPPERSRSRSPRYSDQSSSRVPRHSPSPLRYQSQSRLQRSNDERRHSGPVRRSRSRSQSPIINTIARLETAHYEMFGWYPNMEEYFRHRRHNESRPPLSASGPSRRPLSIEFRPPRPSSGPSGRQLSYNDLRHQLYGTPRDSDRF